MRFEDLFKFSPYSLPDSEKTPLLKAALGEAFDHHFQGCVEFRRFCQKRGFSTSLGEFDYADLPFLPVEIFKKMRLASVDESMIVRTLHSSATTSQTPSTIVIDNITRMRQVKTLMWLFNDFLGGKRRPFVIVDADPSLVPPGQLTISAHTAAIRGFLTFASQATYCMQADEKGNMVVDINKLTKQLSIIQSQNEPAVVLGFTYIVYAYCAKQLLKKGLKFSLPNVTIIHIGGWKKLQGEAVSKKVFNHTLQEVLGVPASQIIDTYGFVEQLGLVYMDCADGLKRCPLASEMIVRNPQTLEPVPDGEEGLVEFITPLPYSYPGIAILLDDIGRIITREPSPCGRYGTAFEIIGRAKEAEIRGCGDVLSEFVKK